MAVAGVRGPPVDDGAPRRPPDARPEATSARPGTEQPDFRQFKLVVPASRGGAGWAGYWEVERGGERVYEIGWAVIPAFQRRGFASEATRQAVQRARSARGLRYVHAFPDVTNASSNAVCRAVGFELLGAIDNEYLPGTPRRCNDWRLDLQAPRS